MSTETQVETLSWTDVPIGGTVVSSLARKHRGQYLIVAQVKNPPVMAASTQTIPLDSIGEGQEVYLAEPCGIGTLLDDYVLRRVAWGQQTKADLAADIRRMSAQEPLRGVVPYRRFPYEVTAGRDYFPINCYVVVGRKPATMKAWSTYHVWRFWQTPDGRQQRTEIALSDIVSGVPVYVRTDYVEPAAPLGDPFTGHTFMAVDWTQENLDFIDDDMRLRITPSKVDKASESLDIATYHVNQVCLGINLAILAIDPDKRTSPLSLGWTGYVAWALHGSKIKAEQVEAIRAERMR